jgi:hypothetical protein
MDIELKTFFGGLEPFPPSGDWTPATMNNPPLNLEDLATKIPYDMKPKQSVNNTAIRYDQDKPDWSLIPMEALEEVVKVLEFGAKKYHRDNWRTGDGFRYSRVINSLLRHTYAWMRGEDLDPESGFSHLAHMGCNVLFLLYYNRYKERFKNDDRYKP